jgi:hypothetical protein
MVLNVYVGVYDSVLVLPAIILTTSALLRRAGDGARNLPLRFRCLLVGLWVLPWVSGLVARDVGLQPYTVALLALGIYQLHLLKSRSLRRDRYEVREMDLSVARATSPCEDIAGTDR